MTYSGSYSRAAGSREMLRIAVVILALVAVLQGTALGQGLLDSILGPGGFGLWGNQPGNQFDSPQYYGGNSAPNAQMPWEQGYTQGYPPQGYAQPQVQGYPQGSWQPSGAVYPDWQGYQPPGAAPPPVQYSAPPPQAPVRQAQPASTQAQPPRVSVQPPVDQDSQFDDSLPAGSVRITTTTPEGTTVQFYPPAPQQQGPKPAMTPSPARRPPAARRSPQSPRARASAKRQRSRTKRQSTSAIAMPRPVQIPQGQDPRAGWPAAVNRAPGPSTQ